MNLNNELHQLTARADKYLAYQEDLAKVEELQELVDSSRTRQRPHQFSGVVFHDEGLETIAGGRRDITPTFSLPAREVEWDFEDGAYEIEVQVSSPATLTLRTLEGRVIVENRRVFSTARLDIRSGGVVLESTAPIEHMRIWRFEKRYNGSAVFGPFSAEGIVSAKVIGHGSWKVQVASNYVMPGAFVPNGGAMTFSREGDAIWRGRGPESTTLPIPQSGVPYSKITLLGAPPEPLLFGSSVESGRVAVLHETIEFDAPTEVDFDSSVSYWALPNRWKRMGALTTASDRPVYQTHVWGRVEGAGRVFDARSGKEVSQSGAEGQYVAQAQELSAVNITGTYAAQGEAVRLTTDPKALTVAATPAGEGRAVLPAGTYHKVEYAENPTGVYVKIEGRGQARAIELQVQCSCDSLEGHIIERTKRIDLAPFFDAQSRSTPSAAFEPAEGIMLPLG